MMTASVKFLGSSLLADMTCRESELRQHLQSIGILTFPNMITLDNTRTLQIHLTPDDEIGEALYRLVDTSRDTLGNVQRLCRHVYCMNDETQAAFMDIIEKGEIISIRQGLTVAENFRKRYSTIKSR